MDFTRICHGLIFMVFCCFTNTLANGNTRTIILPPVPLGPEAPICSSYSMLCHLAYNLTDTGSYQVWHSNQQICRCPGNRVCPTDWANTDRSITKVFKSAGQEVEVKMSYCVLNQPDTVCRQDEPTVVTRGRGAFTFEIASEFQCRCYRQMYAHRSWRKDDYDYIEYSCGKPRCGQNRLPEDECTKITYNGSPNNLLHDYLCRCRRNEECIGGELPTESNRVVMRTCQRLTDEELDRRRRIRRNRDRK